MAHGLTLVLNVGSSTLKAALFAPPAPSEGEAGPQRLWQEQRERGASISADADPGAAHTGTAQPLDHQLEAWLGPALQPWWPQIQRAGHRLVHGGEHFTAPARLDGEALAALAALHNLAPLHNPPALAAIHWLQRWRPALPQWACFDTAFHASLPVEARTYALPEAWRSGGRRRYGFHGLSHQHLAQAAARRWRDQGHTGLPRLISCHLGAGCSLAAIRAGCSIDTTMGFTPLEGLVMASRSGSVDPGLVLDLLRQGVSAEALEQGLQGASGLLGLSGLSGDWLQLRRAAAEGHAGAQLALGVFRHRLLAGIGAMAASLGGVDMIGLTGGIGARDQALLADLQGALGWLGPLQWLQEPADEEAMIAALISDPADRGSDAAGGSGAADRH